MPPSSSEGFSRGREVVEQAESSAGRGVNQMRNSPWLVSVKGDRTVRQPPVEVAVDKISGAVDV